MTYLRFPSVSKPFEQLWVLLVLQLSWGDDFSFYPSLRLRLFPLHHIFAQLCKLFLSLARFSCRCADWCSGSWYLGWQSLILLQLDYFIRLLLLEHHLQILGFILKNFYHCCFKLVSLNFISTFWLNEWIFILYWCNTRSVFWIYRNSL